jgi:predicted Ser/Thr protein kinase
MPETRIQCPEAALQDSLGGCSFEELWELLRGPVCREHRTRSTQRVETQRGAAFAKRFGSVQLKNVLWLRWGSRPAVRSQAAREARIIDALASRGFAAPRVLLLAEELGLLRERRSLLLLAPLEGRPLCENDAALQDETLLLRIARHLGSVLASGILLPDLGTDHVYLMPNGDFGLLDFTNAYCTRRPRARTVARALIRFFRSPRAEELIERGAHARFAATYLESAERPDAMSAWRKLARTRLHVELPA